MIVLTGALLLHVHTGMVAGDFDPVNQSVFVVERKEFSDLVTALVRPCPCDVRACWTFHSLLQVFTS